jgi:hypothetical protein
MGLSKSIVYRYGIHEDVDMTYTYIAKPDKYGMIFHLVSNMNDHMSLCGTAMVGEKGYEFVEKDEPVRSSVRCANCARSIIVGGK